MSVLCGCSTGSSLELSRHLCLNDEDLSALANKHPSFEQVRRQPNPK